MTPGGVTGSLLTTTDEVTREKMVRWKLVARRSDVVSFHTHKRKTEPMISLPKHVKQKCTTI